MASKLPRLLDTASKFAIFSVSGFKDEKFIKKQTYVKTVKNVVTECITTHNKYLSTEQGLKTVSHQP